MAWAFVAHTDSRFEPELLRRFVNSYQRVQPLTIGELWALAITLRVVLVENLRKLADSIVRSRRAREEADRLVDGLLGNGDLPSISPIVLRRFEDEPLERAFAVQLVQRLRDLDPKVGPILLWLDKRLDAQGTTSDEIVRAEHQDQTAMTVTVRNVITSMRLMSAFDWHEFFESISLVDEVLRERQPFRGNGFFHSGLLPPRHRRTLPAARTTPKSKLPGAPCSARSKRSASTSGDDARPAESQQMEPGLLPDFKRPRGI